MANSEITTAAYVLLIEGVAVSFWTSEDAAAAVDVERTTTHVGLELPRLSHGFSLTDGWLTDSHARFKISDVDDTLAALFAATRSDKAPLTQTIEPGDTPAASWRSKHVGTEYIGAAGERRQYPVVPGWHVGMRHPDDAEASVLGLGSVPVTADPLLWAGRRCAVYRFKYEDGAWQTWANSARIWWGTIKGTGYTRGREWEITAMGPASWLRKSLGYSAPADATPVVDAEIDFGGETDITVRFDGFDNGELSTYGTASASVATASAAGVRTAMASAITAALSDNSGAQGEFNGTVNTTSPQGEPNGDAGFLENQNDIYIQIQGVSTVTRECFMHIVAPERAWRALGYDPVAQSDMALLNGDDPLTYVDFSVAEEGLPYYQASFSTKNPKVETEKDNDGAKRWYQPWYGDAGDNVYTLYAAGGQEVYLAFTSGEQVYCRGQHDIPCPDDPASPGAAYTFSGGGTADSTRLWAFIGPRRADGAEDAVTQVWVGRCAWVDSNGAVGLQDQFNDRPALYVSEWLDQAAFGFPPTADALKDKDWSAPLDSIVAVPLHHLTHTADGYMDRPVRLARNILVGTGTSGGWFTDATYTTQQFGSGGKLQPGDNEPALNVGLRPADGEIEDLTLGIPAEMVMGVNDFAAVAEAIEDDANSCKLALVGRFSSEDALLGITRPLGLCWSLRGGKYSVFAPIDGISPDDVDHTITTESYHAPNPSDGIQRQRLTVAAPLDLVTLRYGHNPVEREPAAELKIKATDEGARYRANNTTLEIDAPGIRANAVSALLRRWRRIFEFWNRRHFELVGVDLHFDSTIFPGDTVRWTDAALVNPDGTYGVSGYLGYITSVTHDCKREVTTVDAVLVQQPTDGYRMVAPLAVVTRYDSGGPTLYCEKDAYSVSSGGFNHVDVAAFAEPAWSTSGGAAAVTVWQYDGNTWTTAGHSTVSSVDTAANTITLGSTLSGGTGYYRDRDSIVVFRSFANQTAQWVLDYYAPIADDAGEVGGNAANAVQWNDAE